MHSMSQSSQQNWNSRSHDILLRQMLHRIIIMQTLHIYLNMFSFGQLGIVLIVWKCCKSIQDVWIHVPCFVTGFFHEANDSIFVIVGKGYNDLEMTLNCVIYPKLYQIFTFRSISESLNLTSRDVDHHWSCKRRRAMWTYKKDIRLKKNPISKMVNAHSTLTTHPPISDFHEHTTNYPSVWGTCGIGSGGRMGRPESRRGHDTLWVISTSIKMAVFWFARFLYD